MIDLGIQKFLEKTIPLPIDQLRLVIWVLLCFPLSIILNRIKSNIVRLYSSTLLAFYIQYSVLGFQAYFLWLQIAIVYLMCLYCPRQTVGRYVTYQSFAYLSIIHFRRFVEDSGVQVDVTAILMMNTCKFIMFAFCYQDGAKKPEQLSESQFNLRINQLPGISQYLGFIQFLPSCLVGPAFEYNDYQNYLNSKNDYQGYASTLLPALKDLILSLGCTGVYVLISIFCNPQYFISDEYIKSSLVKQFFYIMIMMQGVRMKYYAIWLLSMVGVTASGLNYQKIVLKNGSVTQSFKKIQVCNIFQVETGTSLKVKIDNWNMSVQQFLKRYVYDRLSVDNSNGKQKTSKAMKDKAQSATIILSAFWHGFYPSYITSFFHWMLVLQVTQQVYRIGKDNQVLKNLYNNYKITRLLCVLIMNFYFSYYGVFFVLFRLNKIWVFSQSSMNLPSFIVYIAYYLIVMKKVGTPTVRIQKQE